MTDDLVAGVRSLVASRLGLAFPSKRTRELVDGLTEAAREGGAPSVEAFARRLLATRLAEPDLMRLARHLTIGETYFFRDSALFEALERRVLPRLISERAATTKSLRVWSAGCATGEETYSLAILLSRLLPDQAGWSVSIVGSDVNQAAVEAAQDGVYGAWSFRETPDWVKQRFFQPLGRGRLRVVPAARQLVEFRVHNLVEDPFPAGVPGDVDLILCRNVLMYLDPAQAGRVVRRFGSVLSADGCLIPSPYEASDELFGGLQRDRTAAVPLYRSKARPSSGAHLRPAEPARSAQPARRRPAATTRAVRKRPSRAETAGRATTATPRPAARRSREASPAGRDGLLRRAKAEADRGDVDRAAELCAAAIEADRRDPKPRYLLATIELERGRSAAAARALSEAIYLDPTFVLAHVALGNLRSAQGRVADARRAYASALALLAARPATEEIEASEGLTADDLTALVTGAVGRLAAASRGERAAASVRT